MRLDLCLFLRVEVLFSGSFILLKLIPLVYDLIEEVFVRGVVEDDSPAELLVTVSVDHLAQEVIRHGRVTGGNMRVVLHFLFRDGGAIKVLESAKCRL